MSSDGSFWKWLGGLIVAGLMFLLSLGASMLIHEAMRPPKETHPVVTPVHIPRQTFTR